MSGVLLSKDNLVDIQKKTKEAAEKKAAYLKLVRDSFQIVGGTDAGKIIIEYLITESRAFGNSLKAVSNLQKVYGVSADYFNAQADFGKNILQFLTPSLVAELIFKSQKEE